MFVTEALEEKEEEGEREERIGEERKIKTTIKMEGEMEDHYPMPRTQAERPRKAGATAEAALAACQDCSWM